MGLIAFSRWLIQNMRQVNDFFNIFLNVILFKLVKFCSFNLWHKLDLARFLMHYVYFFWLRLIETVSIRLLLKVWIKGVNCRPTSLSSVHACMGWEMRRIVWFMPYQVWFIPYQVWFIPNHVLYSPLNTYHM